MSGYKESRRNRKMRKIFNSISSETVKALKDIKADKIFQSRKRLKVAVTGLSRSGKTVFITSLINQLISGQRLKSVINDRDFVARIIPKSGEIPSFNYYGILEKVRSNKPEWPESTKSISQIEIELEIKSDSEFFPNQFLNLEIIDYPGEWLLDLPMLGMTYEDWCEYSLNLAENESRAKYMQQWKDAFKSEDLYNYTSSSKDKNIVEKYTSALFDLKKGGFSIIQPGRLIQPDNLENKDIIQFTPLPKPQSEEDLHDDSIYNRFRERYKKYVDEVVLKLALEYFSNYDRQVVLIDVLKTFTKGYDSFIDMIRALNLILQSFDYGNSGFIQRLFSPKIDKTIFVATKADHIANKHHFNYQQLLESIIEEAKRELEIKGVDTISTIVASVKSTKNLIKEHDGIKLACLKGRLQGKDKESIEYTGELPMGFPSKEKWNSNMLKFQNFSPIPFPDRDIESVPNIKMDTVIKYLIEDFIK
jgi:predicted YcjX-like family ATPase